MRGDYAQNTPTLLSAARRLEEKMAAKGLVPHFAAKVGEVLRASRAFDEVTVKTVTVPLNAALVSGTVSITTRTGLENDVQVTIDPAVCALNETLRKATITAIPVWQGGLLSGPEEHTAFLRETSQSGRDWFCEHDYVFTWSRKKSPEQQAV